MRDISTLDMLASEQRSELRRRLRGMMDAGSYSAALALARLGEIDDVVTERAIAARDRLLGRRQPDGTTFYFGEPLVNDAYLVTFLDVSYQRACLDKMLTVAADGREVAQARQDALTAASNLVIAQPEDIKADVHTQSRAFVDGHHDGSTLDTHLTSPHPLSTVKINLGSVSLRAAGLNLARCSAVTDEDKAWVRQRAADMLSSNDDLVVHQAALTLHKLGASETEDLDATLLAGHRLPIVRQLAAVVAVNSPDRYDRVLLTLAADPEASVRSLLARKLHAAVVHAGASQASDDPTASTTERGNTPRATANLLQTLAADIRHTVRRSAAGFTNQST